MNNDDIDSDIGHNHEIVHTPPVAGILKGNFTITVNSTLQN